jgi:hypothetical protein
MNIFNFLQITRYGSHHVCRWPGHSFSYICEFTRRALRLPSDTPTTRRKEYHHGLALESSIHLVNFTTLHL